MEQSQAIVYPAGYKPEKPDIIKNYATESQIYAHPLSPSIVTLVQDLKNNKAYLYLVIYIESSFQVCNEKEANVSGTI
jgi:hypothetical protein